MKRSKDAGKAADTPVEDVKGESPQRATLSVKRAAETDTENGAPRREGVRARFQPGFAKAVGTARAAAEKAAGGAKEKRPHRKQQAGAGDNAGRSSKEATRRDSGRDEAQAGREPRAPRTDRPPRSPRPGSEDRAFAPRRPRTASEEAAPPARAGRSGTQERTSAPRAPRPAPERPSAERGAPPQRRPARSAPGADPVPAGRRPERTARAIPDPAAADAAAEGVRLSKVMSERGLCSRREADAMIERGWVFVDGRRVSELGTRIDPNAEITLASQARQRQAERVTILLHKPVGYVSGQPEPGYEPAVSLIGAANQYDRETAQPFDFSHLKGIAPAGRLDIDSTGLLVLTQDGRIARQLIGDDSEVDKEYLVRVEGELDEHGLALLNHGLELDGRKLRRAKVEWINEDQLRFVLREGRKRQIRRMCELVGLKVVGLKRIRIGHVRLGDLPLGQWRFLREDEGF